ncbi:MAG TPA: hypothetical protein VM513_24110 [Kofleriaceae bacterium]|jgi:hypothetical protein|nr:hypothetical protein [Enhygromyxa sp.]HVK87231.1 hypothetical protein [Kofleriaceae bacterium]
MGRCRLRLPPSDVSMEMLSTEKRLRTPYRGIETGKQTLRIRVQVQARNIVTSDVVIDVDDLAIEVHDGDLGFVLGAGAIDALFVVERQPRAGFLTWFGVFARRKGRADRLVLETPSQKVARYVERLIEDWLGLDDEPVRGELRID